MAWSELVALAVLSCACARPHARPHPRAYYPAHPYYNLDAVSAGGGEGSQRAAVLSRYYQPYSYLPSGGGGGGGMAAFMYGTRAPAAQLYPSYQQREQAPFGPSAPSPARSPEPPAPSPEPLDTTEAATPRATLDLATEELEPETPRPTRRRLVHKKRVERPADEDEDEQENPFPPMNAYFPMFFGYGRRGGSSGGGGAGGATAIANAYSTGRGGVATSHATAYGPRPDQRR